MRIAVIADDLTGAAEIGGIGIKYGLKVEISRNVNTASPADMLVINTDARSMNEAEAIEVTRNVSEQLKSLNPQFVFKKTDSVLRGHVLAEIAAQCKAMNFSSAIIVPANPSLGRTLVKGHYYINNIPIHQTSFKDDPEFPVTHSHILTRFKSSPYLFSVMPHFANTNNETIIVGEAEVQGDLNNWADKLTNRTLAAGAAGFFTACLNKLIGEPQGNNTVDEFNLAGSILYISGSTFKPSVTLIEELNANNGPVSYMPENLAISGDDNETLLHDWAVETASLIEQQKKAVMSIPDNNNAHTSDGALHKRSFMARAVKKVFDKVQVNELVIEGGSTAAAILDLLNIHTMVPVQELAPGVIRSAVPNTNLHITLKPGSYSWSKSIWAF
ncbi:four-carbon acid sugar kinase family protein [Mucilaginibacter aquatilis]|uniref:Four-carbon acid sugar kinase family protein n=1 Tax=Mucilaginibacter aquatilis TaxID=1517760 RepID=A0A6I4IAG7_9SPHI|nr:four-carbon acid sugar kinase family protein [Mucilaginibacter aquatilis]MVN91927.1 hypothetical protein [Mucilaginibacter aquatilis]